MVWCSVLCCGVVWRVMWVIPGLSLTDDETCLHDPISPPTLQRHRPLLLAPVPCVPLLPSAFLLHGVGCDLALLACLRVVHDTHVCVFTTVYDVCLHLCLLIPPSFLLAFLLPGHVHLWCKGGRRCGVSLLYIYIYIYLQICTYIHTCVHIFFAERER